MRITSYHTYRAKIWGVSLLLAIVEVLVWGSGALIPLMVLAGGDENFFPVRRGEDCD
ncbi:MAG: hypothetical protein HY595_01715 [Candidatus Omnitrophica bacterium]|nr:hypothetical protein [Candidatus Omnitrophota bacterium]